MAARLECLMLVVLLASSCISRSPRNTYGSGARHESVHTDGGQCATPCAERFCGFDACGNWCGDCGPEYSCSSAGACVADVNGTSGGAGTSGGTMECDQACGGGRQCGMDACGNWCGDCPDGMACDASGSCTTGSGGTTSGGTTSGGTTSGGTGGDVCTAGGTGEICNCSGSAPCSQTCGSGCITNCGDAQTCSGSLGPGSVMNCQQATSCSANLGSDSVVNCGSAQACSGTLMGGSVVNCSSAGSCAFSCSGDCVVWCGSGTCSLSCVNGAPSTCTDGHKVCGGGC